MQLTVVGCWSPYPAPGSACSAYLIESENTALLIDCGHGAMAQLYHYIQPELLSGVIITHSHPDHAADLPALRHYWRSRRFLGQDLAALPVWMPPEDKDRQYFKQTPEFELKMAVETAELGALKLEFTPGQHTLPVAMVKVSSGNKAIFYTGDTAVTAAGVNASRDCDLLVAECTLPPQEQHMAGQLGHLTWEECGRWGTDAGCPRLLATHFWPEYKLEEIARVVAGSFRGELIMARPGLRVEV